jgi:hypothetical protein
VLQSMKTLSELTTTATCSEIIEKLSYAAEFDSMTVKHNEKRLLKELNGKVLFKRPSRAGASQNHPCWTIVLLRWMTSACSSNGWYLKCCSLERWMEGQGQKS